jgi:hypothetical protein
VSAEATVVAVAVAIYLADCVVLLERGQALRSRAGLSFGSRHYQIRGRAVALLNPFTPFIQVLRTMPLFSAGPGIQASNAEKLAMPLLALCQFVLVFVALPYGLYRAPGWPILGALILAYANAIAMLGVLWSRSRAAGIPARPLVAFGFAWLACLPLSVNAPRKAGLAFDIAMDARAAIRLLPEPAQERARSDLAAQLAEAMQELDESDEQRVRLANLHRELTQRAGA